MPLVSWSLLFFAGFSASTALLTALQISAGGERALARAYAAASVGLGVYCLIQAIGYASPDPAVQDFVFRAAPAFGAVFVGCIVVVYLALTGTRLSRFDQVLFAVVALTTLASLLSPGGTTLLAVTAVERRVHAWGEVSYWARGEPDPLRGLAYLAFFGSLGRMLTLAVGELRRQPADSRRGRWLGYGLLTLPFALFVGLVWNGLAFRGLVAGPMAMEFTSQVYLGVLGWVIADRQRRWRAERAEALERANAMSNILSALLDHGKTLAWLLSPTGEVVHANRVALRLAGATPNSVEGRRLSATPWWSHREAMPQPLEAAVVSAAVGQPQQFSDKLRAADGRQLDVELSITPFRDGAGAVRWLIVEGHDLTERLEREQRVREAAKLEAVGRLAGGVAHDFNNLLTVIVGATEQVLLRTGDQTARDDLQQVLEAATRASGLTRQLLAFARRGTRQRSPLRLGALASETVALFARTAGPAVKLNVRNQSVDDTVAGDPGALQGLLLNLLLNARDAMPAGGTLTVSTSRAELQSAEVSALVEAVAPGPYVLLEVHDTGTGIDAATRERLFEPFFTTKAPGKGSGLGLASVLGTVREHHAGLAVHSPPGGGTIFRVYFPPGSSPALAPSTPAAPPTSTPGKVLVVDDEALVREVVVRDLQSSGFSTVAVDSGAAALEQLSRGGFVAAIIDVSMPEMDGPTLVKRLRQTHPLLSVVLCSGFHGGEVLDGLGVDPRLGYVEKPFRARELTEALAALGVACPPVVAG